jgi:transposase
MSRLEAAAMGGMERQTLRDWVTAFNAHGPDGLYDGKRCGAPPKLNSAQQAKIKALILKGPDPAKDKVVRWRCSDVRAIIKRDFAVEISDVSVSRLLKRLGYLHVSARPRHPAQASNVIETCKKTSARTPAMR